MSQVKPWMYVTGALALAAVVPIGALAQEKGPQALDVQAGVTRDADGNVVLDADINGDLLGDRNLTFRPGDKPIHLEEETSFESEDGAANAGAKETVDAECSEGPGGAVICTVTATREIHGEAEAEKEAESEGPGGLFSWCTMKEALASNPSVGGAICDVRIDGTAHGFSGVRTAEIADPDDLRVIFIASQEVAAVKMVRTDGTGERKAVELEAYRAKENDPTCAGSPYAYVISNGEEEDKLFDFGELTFDVLVYVGGKETKEPFSLTIRKPGGGAGDLKEEAEKEAKDKLQDALDKVGGKEGGVNIDVDVDEDGLTPEATPVPVADQKGAECPVGEKFAAKRDCACPEGYERSQDGTECVAAEEPADVRPPKPGKALPDPEKACAESGGEYVGGACECPEGTELKGAECVKTEEEEDVPPAEGMVCVDGVFEDGNCECPTGMEPTAAEECKG